MIRPYGFNRPRHHKKSDALTLLLGQFKSPIILILIFAASLSLFLGSRINALIILGIVIVNCFSGSLTPAPISFEPAGSGKPLEERRHD